MIFQYPQHAHVRRHGPRGYADYQAYKPWLRDEFDFRCVYCLWRERWYAAGDAAFSVEHLQSQFAAPELVGEYDNLVYACCRCNSAKSDASQILDPCQTGFGQHLEVLEDGSIHGLTVSGRELIRICRLAEPLLVESRRQLLELFRLLNATPTATSARLRQHYLGVPSNLPMLRRCRPPHGNRRPDGIAQSYLERLRRGEVSATY